MFICLCLCLFLCVCLCLSGCLCPCPCPHAVQAGDNIRSIFALDDGLAVLPVPILKLRVELQGDDLQATWVVVPGEVAVDADHIHVGGLETGMGRQADALNNQGSDWTRRVSLRRTNGTITQWLIFFWSPGDRPGRTRSRSTETFHKATKTFRTGSKNFCLNRF